MKEQTIQATWFQELRSRLDESLFPVAPRPQPPVGRRQVAALVGFFLAVVALQLFRPGLSVSFNSVWAEDGTMFLQGGLTHGLGQTLFTPYARYLVLVPRMIGEVASFAPLRDAPGTISVLAGCVVAASGLAVWYGAAGHVRNPYLRGALAIFTTLAPTSGLESLVSASYVSWYMLFGTFWLLLWRPKSALATSLSCLFVLATTLSNPGVWFFLPLAALRAIAIRDRHDAAIVACFALGCAIQAPVLAFSSEAASAPIWTNAVWVAYLQRVVAGGALGLELAGHCWKHWGWKFLGPCVAAGAAVLFVGFRYSTRNARWLAVVAIPTSLLMFVVSAYQRAVGGLLIWPAHMYSDAPSRYVMAPALILAGVAVAFADGFLRRHPGRMAWVWPGVALVAVMAIAVATSFDMEELAGRGTPPWDQALRRAATTCVAKEHRSAAITISPAAAGFQVILPCDRISSFAPSQRRALPKSPSPPSR